FSHVGIACWDEGRLWVYDVENGGARKVPFEVWMLDVTDCLFAIKRVCEPLRDRVPQVLCFCESAYNSHVPFDLAFGLDDDAFYCSELVEKAYRSAGVLLSEPVPLCCFPYYHRYCYLRPAARVLVGIDVKVPVYAPGNAAFGVYSSPVLELVY